MYPDFCYHLGTSVIRFLFWEEIVIWASHFPRAVLSDGQAFFTVLVWGKEVKTGFNSVLFELSMWYFIQSLDLKKEIKGWRKMQEKCRKGLATLENHKLPDNIQ